MIYDRHIAPRVTKALKDSPVILINGARQTGKSTFCEQLIKTDIFKGQFVTLDDATILSAATRNPSSFLEGLDKHVVIDEIQRVPELLLGIKKLVDQDRKGRRFILTGSADVLALPKLADSLAGRMHIYNLWPLSQAEINAQKNNFIDHVFSEFLPSYRSDLKWTDFVSLMIQGGYPGIMDYEEEETKRDWYGSYLISILQKDIRDLSNIEGLTEIPNLLELLSTRTGGLLNLSEISRLAQMANTTLKRYYALLQQVFLILEVPAWTLNLEGRLVKSPKLFLNDTGLLCYLRRETKDNLINNRTAAGSILENFVVMEITKQITWAATRAKMFHFRAQSGQEVDIVLEGDNKKIVGIEVKSSASVTEKEFKGLEFLKAHTKNKFHCGIVLYTGDQTVKFGDKLYALPISSLWS